MTVNKAPLLTITPRVGAASGSVPVGNLVTVIEISIRPLVKSITEPVSLVNSSPTDDPLPLPPP